MGWIGNNFIEAKRQAQANANTFLRPYFVNSTTAGLYVEREPAGQVMWVAYPPKWKRVGHIKDVRFAHRFFIWRHCHAH